MITIRDVAKKLSQLPTVQRLIDLAMLDRFHGLPWVVHLHCDVLRVVELVAMRKPLEVGGNVPSWSSSRAELLYRLQTLYAFPA